MFSRAPLWLSTGLGKRRVGEGKRRGKGEGESGKGRERFMPVFLFLHFES